jgi:hypothetical protein
MNDRTPPRVLYHYTAPKSLLGILKDRALLATKIRYLSDGCELIGPLRIALDILKQREEKSGLSDEQKSLIRETRSFVEDSRNINIPVVSFTAKGDEEPLWDEFADAGSGYAMGLDSSKLCPPGYPVVLSQCEYADADMQRDTIQKLITLELDRTTLAGQPPLYFRLMTMALRMKSEPFAAEDEWRLVPRSCHWPDLLSYTYWTCKFRPERRGLIPCWLLPIDLSAIVEIVVGPALDPELAVDGVKALIHRFDLSKGIQISVSKRRVPQSTDGERTMSTALTKAQMEAICRLTLEENASRADAITSACEIEQALRGLLRTAMIDDRKVDDLFEDSYGPLSTFSSQIKCAWAIGLIDGELRKDLDYIRLIRNRFAHENEQKLFSTSPVRDWLQQLSPVKNGRVTIKDHSRSEYGKVVFEIRLTLMALMLKKLNREESIEQLREMSREMVSHAVDAIVPPRAPNEGVDPTGEQTGS